MKYFPEISFHVKHTFCQLMLRLQTSQQSRKDGYLEIPMTVDSSLIMEKLPDQVKLSFFDCDQYRLTYRYISPTGAFIRNPEMTFVVIDSRTHWDDYAQVSIFPSSYTSDQLKVSQFGLTFDGPILVAHDEELCKNHAYFADVWLREIEQKGYPNTKWTKVDSGDHPDQP